MSDEDAMMQQAQALQNAGEQKFGRDTFSQMINSVGRSGVPQEALKQIVRSPTALKDFTALSQEAMLLELQRSGSVSGSDYRALDDAYRSLRDVQKADHRSRR
jgi:hypothetical protein